MSARREWSALAARLTATDLSARVNARLRALGPTLVRGIIARALRGVDADGRPWPRRADGTSATLYGTGAMLGALHASDEPDGIALGYSDTQQARKAAAHQGGTRHLPRRAFLGLDAAQRRTVLQAVRESLGGVL